MQKGCLARQFPNNIVVIWELFFDKFRIHFDSLGSFGVNLLSLKQHNITVTEWRYQISTGTNIETFFRKGNWDQIFQNKNQRFFPSPNSPKPILFPKTKFSETKTKSIKLKNNGNQPKIMKNHKTTLKTMETKQKPWKTMKPPWKTIETNQKPWKIMKPTWKIMETNQKPWKTMKPPRKTTETNQKPWKTMKLTWKTMETNQNHETTLKNHGNQPTDLHWSKNLTLLTRGPTDLLDV